MYLANFLQTLIMLAGSACKYEFLIFTSGLRLIYVEFLREPLEILRSRPTQSLTILVAFIPLLLIYSIIFSLASVLLLAAISIGSGLAIVAFFLFFVGAPFVFLVWFSLYRYPVFDILYPRLRSRMLQHNGRVYGSLPNSGAHTDHCIRVVRLKPGIGSQSLECDLVAETLSDASFEALSYVWGVSLIPYKIAVNGQPFYVTPNLYAALRCLRQPADERSLWIDALAINQADVAEKSLQVQRMRDVYRKASKVIVWLGKESKATPAAFQLAQDMGSASGSTQEEYWEQASSKKSWASNRQEWCRILDHQWWRRSWIIQEVVLSNHIVVQRGTHQIPWDTFQNFLENPLFRREPSLDEESITFSQHIRDMRSELESVGRTSKSLFDLAFHFRHQSATLGSDKLFALQGLLPFDTPIELVPDYSKSSEDVFIEFTAACIGKRKDPVILALAFGVEVYGVSWCRDWTFEYDGLTPIKWFSIYYPSHREYSAAGGHPASYTIDIPRRVLSVRGFTVDRVAKRTATQRQLRHDGVNWHTVLQLWESSMSRPFEDDPTSKRSFNRTITADRWPESSMFWEDRISRHGPLGLRQDNKDYWNDLDEVCLNRKMFLTEGGRLGLGSSSVEKGDLVCVLLGSRVPFVLRRCGKGDLEGLRADLRPGDGRDYFKLVGEAYVDGVMYYEGDIEADLTNGKIKTEEYNLL